ncbi:cation:proton antiporter [Catenuloplanes atrovinosus]|uniref:CPA1 family monovalent cation:H+ antiporter n=1 Tax=Catenuloplanes atrovinosus TaxID=137266 RepID=A0AAE3YQ34_9ACTN|nr:sodium:proton antiporter [Catenuloplanes atrovinosus]MDR7276264.1 CPA1 family monovalent cation:H+ antiporter [Catenuloplanes atrovinosus]
MNGVQLLLIAGAGIAIAAVARRKGLEPGMFIVILAAAASFVPGMPRLELESEVILAIVVPPLLYSAARGASFSGFRRHLRPIVSLGVILVVLTAGALGLIAGWLLPSIGAAAFVLGAVLAPPDTITTVSHGEEIGLPERATSVLTGESLVNDATALTLFSIAVAAVNGEHATFAGGVQEFARSAFLGVAIGALLSAATLLIRRWLRHATLETALVLLLPFTAFLAAEAAHVSGILAVVAASFLVSVNLSLDPNHEYPGAYRARVRENEVWPVLDFLLETFVFAYIGLQLRFVLEDLAESEEPGLSRTLLAGGVLLVAAIVLRLAGVYGLFGRWMLRARMTSRRLERDPAYRAAFERRYSGRRARPLDPPTQRETLLVGWTGMRGILTLAAAAAIPETTASGAPFPGRDAIQAIALIVTLGTLVIQGTTVGALARALTFDLAGERAAREAARAAGRALLAGRDFDDQRMAVRIAMRDGTLSEEVARELIDEIDLRQAAGSTPM